MGFDIDRARLETPGVKNVAHFNNAGAALAPAPVTDAVIEHLRREAEVGSYEAGTAATDRIESAYDSVARLLHCDRDEIAMVENATRAWDMAFYAMTFQPGNRILTSRSEYASNVIAFLQVAARSGAVVEVIEDDEHGQLSITDLRRRLERGRGTARAATLIAVTHVPSHGGLVNPVEEVGSLAREFDVPFLLDACQSVGQMPVDVDRIGCDMLSATGRKFLRGPRGTGILYVRRSMLDRLQPPFLDLHSAIWTAADRYEMRPDARRFETWEANYAGRIGLGVAVDYALSWGLEAIESRVVELAGSLRARLQSTDQVTIHDQGLRPCAIVTFSVAGVPAQEVRDRLFDEGINTSIALSSGARWDLPHRGLDDLVRASVHYYNTEHEIDRLIEALPQGRRINP